MSHDALTWLYSTQLFGIKLGLDGITHLLSSLNLLPLPTPARVIHVAGTNGKGSTCATIERVARAAGYRTALFTSPHLVHFHERIRVNAIPIPDADLTRLILQLRAHIELHQLTPTFFELVFALALLYYHEQQADLLILETGMGGRLDATNALPKDVAVITPIALDHTQYLGDTLPAVAAEKAGIIHHGNHVISALQAPEAAAVIHDRCLSIGATLTTPPPTLPAHYQLSLLGAHQRDNAALALAALRALPHWHEPAEDTLQHALLHVEWAGRFQQVPLAQDKNIILDGAHNPHAMRALLASWHAAFPSQPTTPCLFACSADKELPAVIELLTPLIEHWHLVPVDSPRIMPPAELAPLIAELSPHPITIHATLREGLYAISQSSPRSLACGSFFLLGELQALLDGSHYHSTTQ